MLNKGSKEKNIKQYMRKFKWQNLTKIYPWETFAQKLLRMKTSESTLPNLICHKIFLFHVVNFTISLIT